MDVRCDRCETEYELDDGSVSDAGTPVQCTTCGYTFVVTRRSPSQVHTAVTPAQGNAEPSGPAVPEWTLSTDDGKVHRFRDLNTLQKWIVERKASRTDRLSRAGGPWLALGEMDEFASFFKVVDEADRARVHHPIAPSSSSSLTPAAPMPAVRSPSNRIDAAAAAREPVQFDAPTVPNLRLPDVRPSGTAAPRGSEPTPGSGVRAAAAGRNVAGHNPRTPPPTPVAAIPASTSGSGAISSPVPKPIVPDPSHLPPEGRKPAKTDLVFSTDTTLPVDGDLSLPTSRTRNVLIAVALASAAAIGGIVWSQRGADKPASVATAPAAPTSEPVAVEAPQPPAGPAVPAAKVDPSPAAPPAAPNPTPTTPTANPTAKTAASAPAAGRASAPAAGKLAGRSSDGPASKTAAGTYDRLVSDADRLLERGQGAKAEKLYEQALNAKPNGVAALTGIAYVMLDKQRHFKAIDMFRRALSVQPTYGPALFGIAESYRARGDLPQAVGAYRQYLSISPSGSDAPAARRQLKDLESANAQAAAGKRDSAPASDD